MAITLTNVNSLLLQHILNRTTEDYNTTMTQLSTGLRINSGADDPAGLIAMTSLESEIVAVEASISNNERTDAMLSVADSSLDEIASLLDDIKELAIESTNEDGISASELAANQAQIDSALEAIDQIIGTTQFNGQKLLDGSLGIDVSGVTAADITDLQVYSRDESALSVSVDVQTAATQATVSIASTSATDDTAINIQGKDGSVVIEIAADENLSSVAAKINAATAQTGVTASANGGDLSLISSDYGEDAFVEVTVVDDNTTDTSFSTLDATGTDAVVEINGQAAAVDGKSVSYSANGVSFTFNLTDALNQATGSTTFTVEATGGATFQLGTTSQTRQTIGIDSLYTQLLGDADYGYLSSLAGGEAHDLLTDPNTAAQIATKAAEQIATVQGRIGGFQKYQVSTAINQQSATYESLTAALSTIADVDYAEATSEMNRLSVLMETATALLSVANQQTSQVLSLLQ